MNYLQLIPSGVFPDIATGRPFRAVVVIEERVDPDWQSLASAWLVSSGCLYMMAWGLDSSSWDDSVDMANIEAFGFEEIPEDKIVMTTWHENESLGDVFWFCKYNAHHGVVGLNESLIIHISEVNLEAKMLREYADV